MASYIQNPQLKEARIQNQPPNINKDHDPEGQINPQFTAKRRQNTESTTKKREIHDPQLK